MIVREARLDDALAIALVHVDTWRSTYRGIVPDDYLASLSYEKRESLWVHILSTAKESHPFTYVAEDEVGQIVGFVNGGSERTQDSVYKGELYALLQNTYLNLVKPCLAISSCFTQGSRLLLVHRR
ncbi:MAG: hypothetical protein KME30_24920 [Iphinoe sp. HA4291-MV1]|jgi:hypothetical protein|nr:hypothetical protein [Iphinoe sp. HA4291-MV1]